MKILNSGTERYGFQKGGRNSRDSEPNLAEVITYGHTGAGLWNGHPVGLVIAAGLLVMGLIGFPEARGFFAGAAIFGGFCGFLLWVRHRS